MKKKERQYWSQRKHHQEKSKVELNEILQNEKVPVEGIKKHELVKRLFETTNWQHCLI